LARPKNVQIIPIQKSKTSGVERNMNVLTSFKILMWNKEEENKTKRSKIKI
jgi:hypothetical protein